MSDETLRIEYPTRFPICANCPAAIFLACEINISTIQNTAATNRLGPDIYLKVRCADWLNSTTRVPHPKRQTVMQAQLRGANAFIGLTDGKIIEQCPGKARKLPTPVQVLPPQTLKKR